MVNGLALCAGAGGLELGLRLAHRLHTTGNGVVPLVAAVAFLRLAQRAGLLGQVVAA